MDPRTSIYSVIILFYLYTIIATSKLSDEKIIGGSLTTIDEYPFAVSVFKKKRSGISRLSCGGSILTRTAILTTARCLWNFTSSRVNDVTLLRARVGSSFANSGGTVHEFREFILHPEFKGSFTNNVGVARTKLRIKLIPKLAARAPIAGPDYLLKDDQVLWAIGWGSIKIGKKETSEQLKHVEMRSINQDICNDRYGKKITDDQMCSGWLHSKGVGICGSDTGGPVLHNGTVVGVTSFNAACAHPFYFDGNSRVSYHSDWIVYAARQWRGKT